MKKQQNINQNALQLLIRRGAISSQITNYFACSKGYLLETFKKLCPSINAYKSYLRKIKSNSQNLKKVNDILSIDSAEKKFVIVADDSYLLTAGTQWIRTQSSNIIIPRICMDELLESHSLSATAKKSLESLLDSPRITFFYLKYSSLFERPYTEVSRKAIAIVAICCELYIAGFKVHLYTSSPEVICLAKAQGMRSSLNIN